MEYTTENIAATVRQFYCDASLHKEVHHWLTMAQISPQAWTFSWELLIPQMGVEIQFFGASCLHVKISRYWHELPQSEYENMRKRLFDKIFAFAGGPSIVLTRLCISTAAMILQTTPDFWHDPMPELINMFQHANISGLTCSGLFRYERNQIKTAPVLISALTIIFGVMCDVITRCRQITLNAYVQPERRCHLLLQLITVIPEEVSGNMRWMNESQSFQFFTMNLTRQRRGVIRHELQKALPYITPLLQSTLSPTTPADVSEQALRCFSSWIEFGIPLNEAESQILLVFDKLSDESQFDTAIDALSTVFSHSNSNRYSNTILKLLPHVNNLQSMFQKSIADSNIDTCHGICRLLVAVAENHCKLLVEGLLSEQPHIKHTCLSIINLVLSCTSMPGAFPVHESCSDLTFTFWYMLQDEVVILDTEHYRLILPCIQHIYYTLIDVLLVKAQFPDDNTYNSWSADEKEQLRCYRQDVGDTMMYTFHILREPMLGHLCKKLGEIKDGALHEPNIWQKIEAIYFCFGSVMESVDPAECVYLPALLQLLTEIPTNNVKLVSTALFMIGSLGEWLNGHPDCLSHIIPLLLSGLDNTEVATPATLALKDVTREALDHMQPFTHNIVTRSQDVIEKGILKPRECFRLMSAIGQVLSILPFDQIMHYLNLILPTHIQQLKTASTSQPSNPLKIVIINKLSMIGWLFSSLNTSHDDEEEDERCTNHDTNTNNMKNNTMNPPPPVLCILQDIFPIIQTILSKWLHDPGVVEAVCDLLKRALVTLLDDFFPLSSVVIEILVQMYQAVQHPAVLDVSKQLMLMFSKDANLQPLLLSLFMSLCDITIALLQNSDTLSSHPDIIEEFMQFLSQVVKKNKKVLAGQGLNLLGLFHAGVVGLSVAEHHTVKHSALFMSMFVAEGSELPQIKSVIDSNGHLLVERLLRAIGGESARGVIDYITSVLMSLVTHHPTQISQCLSRLFAIEGFPSVRVTTKDKDIFTKALLMQRVNSPKAKELVKEFTLTCRGLIGTEYASAAIADI